MGHGRVCPEAGRHGRPGIGRGWGLDAARGWLPWCLAVCLACLFPRVASAQWPYQVRRAHLLICSELPPATVRDAIEQLPGLEAHIRQALDLPSRPPEWIQIYLFSTSESLDRYMRRYFPAAPRRNALFIKRRGQGMVFAFYGPQLAQDLRHELTHAILHAHLPMVPLWLDEGLAEYFEQPETSAEYAAASPDAPYPLADLMRLEQITDLRQMGPAEYAQARDWVRWLLHQSAASRRVLLDYLRDLQRHEVPTPISAALDQIESAAEARPVGRQLAR